MSTNEELAMMIKDGNTGLYNQLWEQTFKLLYKHVAALWNGSRELLQRCGLMLDDLQQIAYFALVRAVDAFDPAKGFKLTSYFQYALKNEVKVAIDGGQRKRTPDPLNTCTSLNMPLDDEESAELEDVVPDKQAGQPFEDAEKRYFDVALSSVLWSCVHDLPERQRDVILGKYKYGLSYREISERFGVTGSYIHTLDMLAKNNLRRSARLMRYLDEETGFYRLSGYSTYKNKGASSVELLTEWRERERERLKQIPYYRTNAGIPAPSPQ